MEINQIEDFIKQAFNWFCQEVNFIETFTRIKDEYHTVEYGELSLAAHLANAISRNDLSRNFIVRSEYGLYKDQQSIGRVDLIVERMDTGAIILFECKQHTGKEDDPDKSWNDDDLNEKYDKQIFDQADKYLESSFFADHRGSVYVVSLTFDRVRFADSNKIAKWSKYEYPPGFEGGFYFFNTFLFKAELIGLAFYGRIIQDKNLVSRFG